MLKKRELQDCQALFSLMLHPDVFPYVRQKAWTYDEMYTLTKQTIQAEEQGKLISRTILDELGNPIGTINLFDIENNSGFLGTWLGKEYHGKGYNQQAKEDFFDELFYQRNIENIFMRIKKINTRSLKAIQKFPYVTNAKETHSQLYEQINKHEDIYELFHVSKDSYTSWKEQSQ